MEGNLRFKLDWASLIVGRTFTVFALLTFYLGAISKYKPSGDSYLEGRLNGGFLRYQFYKVCNPDITNFHIVAIRLFVIIPARLSTMVSSRTERLVTVINVSFII